MSPEDDDGPEDRPEETPVHPDAADPKEHQKRESKRKLEARQARDFWRTVFSTEVGRREMYGLLADCGAFRVQHWSGPNGSPDHYATQYYNGQRDLGLRFYHRWMLRNREGVLMMLDENDPEFMKAKKDG